MEEILLDIRKKTRQLIDENNRLRAALDARAAEMDALKGKVAELEHSVADETEKNKVLKMANSLKGDGEETTSAKRRINELVREIDKCIALLNK